MNSQLRTALYIGAFLVLVLCAIALAGCPGKGPYERPDVDPTFSVACKVQEICE